MARQTVSVRRHMNEYIKRKENVMVKQGQNAKTISCIKADTKEPVAGRNGHYKRVPVDTILLREMDYKKEQKAAIHFAKYLNVQKAVSTETKYRKVKKDIRSGDCISAGKENIRSGDCISAGKENIRSGNCISAGKENIRSGNC